MLKLSFVVFPFHVLSHTHSILELAGPLSTTLTPHTRKKFVFQAEMNLEQEEESSMDLWHLSRKDNADDEVEELEEIKFKELLALNLPDWYLVLLGVTFSILLGIAFPFMSVIFSGILAVGARPKLCRQITLYIAFLRE